MSLSIADIDKWNPDSISAVGAASTARANAAAQAGSRLPTLSAFNHWQGAGASAAQARTRALADGLNRHGQDVSTIATAANTAANEVRQIKSQLSELRSTLGQYGIMVDANSSRAVPAMDFSSLPAAKRQLVQAMTTVGQQSLDKLRQAADLADAHLAGAMQPTGTAKLDDFDLDTQYARSQALPGGALPEGLTDSTTDCINATLTVIQITIATYTIHGGGGSDGKHCK
jgi:hypothetical protein